jgi:hypothetical protein
VRVCLFVCEYVVCVFVCLLLMFSMFVLSLFILFLLYAYECWVVYFLCLCACFFYLYELFPLRVRETSHRQCPDQLKAYQAQSFLCYFYLFCVKNQARNHPHRIPMCVCVFWLCLCFLFAFL